MPERAPSLAPLPVLRKVSLAVEAVRAYPGAARVRRTDDLRAMVARARRDAGEPQWDAAARVAEAARLGRHVATVLRFLPGDTRCLTRSLVVLELLARRGVDAVLVIGAAYRPDFVAHAWVEVDGLAVTPHLEHERLQAL